MRDRSRVLWLAAVWLGLAAGPVAHAQALRAVLAGVNDYQFEHKLLGAVNDVNSVAAALRPVAKSLDVFRDGEATREALLGAWDRALAASGRGDTLLIMFSGHGGSEWFGVSAALPRGFQEFWVMPDFDRSTPAGLARRISGSDIEAMLRRGHEKGVETVLLADHCYSGAIYRQAGVDAPRIRQIPTLIAPGAPPLTARPSGSETELSPPLPGLVSLGASRADTPVAEVKITDSGEIHGALSFAFARALTVDRRALDPDGSGAIRLGALLDYLQGAIVEISGGDPQLRSVDPAEEVLFRLPPLPRAITPVPAPPAPTADAKVPMHVLGLPAGEARAVVDGIPDATWAADTNQARVIWDWHDGAPRLLDARGQFVGFEAPRAMLAGAVAMIRDADALALRATTAHMVLRVGDASDVARPVYVEGDAIQITARRPPGPHLVVVDLGWDGQVTLLYPAPSDPPIAWPAVAVRLLDTRVSAPFGEDRLVAVASPHPLDKLEAALREAGGRTGSHEARAAVERALAADPDAEVATSGLFTVPARARCLPEVIRDAAMQAACTVRAP